MVDGIAVTGATGGALVVSGANAGGSLALGADVPLTDNDWPVGLHATGLLPGTTVEAHVAGGTFGNRAAPPAVSASAKARAVGRPIPSRAPRTEPATPCPADGGRMLA